jgi:hypothetical protein
MGGNSGTVYFISMILFSSLASRLLDAGKEKNGGEENRDVD